MGFIDFLSGFADGFAQSFDVDLGLSTSQHEDEYNKCIDIWNSINWDDSNDVDSKVRKTFEYASMVNGDDKEFLICGAALMKARCFFVFDQYDDSLEQINRILSSSYDEFTLNTDFITQCKKDARELQQRVLQTKQESVSQQQKIDIQQQSWNDWLEKLGDVDFTDFSQVQECVSQIYSEAQNNQWQSHYIAAAVYLIGYMEENNSYDSLTIDEKVQWCISKGKEYLSDALSISRNDEVLFLKGIFDLAAIIPNVNATRKIDIIVDRMPKISELDADSTYLNVNWLQDRFDAVYNKKLDLSV